MNKNEIATKFVKSISNNPQEMYRLIHEIDPEAVKFMYEYSQNLVVNTCPHISKFDLINSAMLMGYLLKDHLRRAELDELKGKGLY